MQKRFSLLFSVTFATAILIALGCSHPSPSLENSNVAVDEKQCTRRNFQQCLWVGQAIFNKAIRIKNIDTSEGLYADGTQMFMNGCQWGDPAACFELGTIYQEGKFQDKDIKKAEQYYVQACNEDIQVACASLGDLYITTNQSNKAVRIFQRMCDQNHDTKACQTYQALQRGQKASSYFR